MSKPLVFGVNYAGIGDNSFKTRFPARTPIPDSVILTRSEFEKYLGDAWEACNEWNHKEHMNQVTGESHTTPDKQQFISSIIK